LLMASLRIAHTHQQNSNPPYLAMSFYSVYIFIYSKPR
jgi:hypothetical protein